MAKNHYVDNKQLYAAMVEYKTACREAEESGDDKPPIPDYVGHCLMQIANRLSHKPNFINYSYRDEMISDGIENCINYFDNFDPEKSKNPFAYFTQIIYFAFLRRIQKEKKQLYIRHKTLENSLVMGMLTETNEHDESGAQPAYIDLDNEYMANFVEDFERKAEEKRRKAKGLDKFVEEEKDEDSADN